MNGHLYYPTPLKNLNVKKSPLDPAKLERNPQRAFINIAPIRVFFRPKLSPKPPQMYPPTSIPRSQQKQVLDSLTNEVNHFKIVVKNANIK